MSGHGGKRAGAGAPKKEPAAGRNVRLALSVWSEIERFVARDGGSVHGFVVEAVEERLARLRAAESADSSREE